MSYLYFLRENVCDQSTEIRDIGKARFDVERVLRKLGVQQLPVEMKSVAAGLRITVEYLLNHRALKDALSSLGRNDILLIQYPLIKTNAHLGRLLSLFRKKGGRVILIIHDLDSVRLSAVRIGAAVKKDFLRRIEAQAIQHSDIVIVHNAFMREYLGKTYGYPDDRIIDLELFDYLASPASPSVLRNNGAEGVVIAGNLIKSKAGYAYHLPNDCEFRLYGANCAIDELTTGTYMGSFTPDELPNKLRGSYGLIWDGPSAESCTGTYGQYLRINNPHKASLYISAGLPLIAWSESAIAKFIEKHQVGFAIDSIENLGETIARVSDADYVTFVRNVSALAQKVRTGGFTANAVSKALELLED